MMAPNTVCLTVKYSKPGTQPPLFLAGSFSDPQWDPQEMNHSIIEEREYEFTKEVEVVEGQEYQYKFRIGMGDWWVLNEDSPTVTDDIGNRNNLLSIPFQENDLGVEEEKNIINTFSVNDTDAMPSTKNQQEGIEEVIETDSGPLESLGDDIISDEPTDTNLTSHQIEHKQNTSGPSDTTTMEPSTNSTLPSATMDKEKFQRVDHTNSTEVASSQPKHFAPSATTDSNTDFTNEHCESKIIVTSELDSKSSPSILSAPAPERVVKIEEGDETDLTSSETSATLNTIEKSSNKDPKMIATTSESSSISGTPLLGNSTTENSQIEPTSEAKGANEVKTIANEKVASPAVVVEDDDFLPRHSDDFGAGAIMAQKNAHHLRAQDTESDYVVIRQQSRTPDIASVAAEVADAAEILDPEQPDLPISDEEAGRIGYRRLSQTPIPEVADTAAEVADVAAAIDKDVEADPVAAGDAKAIKDLDVYGSEQILMPSFVMLGVIEENDEGSTKGADYITDTLPGPSNVANGAEAHFSTESGEFEVVTAGSVPIIKDHIKANNNEGEGESAAPTSVNGSQRHSNPGNFTANEADGDKINMKFDTTKSEAEAEENQPTIKVLDIAHQPAPKTSDGTFDGHLIDRGVGGKLSNGSKTAPSPVTPFVVGNRQLGHDEEHFREISTGDDGPDIMVYPATPAASSINTDPLTMPNNNAKSTSAAVHEDNAYQSLTSRKQQATPTNERPLTPSSMRSGGKDAKSKNFLKAFWRVVFIDFLGGLIMRLCGGNRRHALLAISALVVATVIPALYFRS